MNQRPPERLSGAKSEPRAEVGSQGERALPSRGRYCPLNSWCLFGWTHRGLVRSVLLLALAWAAGTAYAVEVHTNFAGSVQLDYLFVPTNGRAREIGFDGFTTELSLKMVTDFGERTSAHVKVCYGCHGFEVGMAYVDFWLLDQLSVRLGRMNPRFGDFPLRHDPANHRANSKPLPYDMGRMLRRLEWNNGILPIPYADNGIEVYGTQWIGDDVSLDYALHAMSGLRGASDAFDIDFVLSRSPALYYVDNNSEPAVGGRLALTTNLSDHASLTVGTSIIHGTYDPEGEQTYTIGGVDVHARLHALVFRAEALVRRTEFAIVGDDFRFDTLGQSEGFFVKQGFYAEVEYPFTAWFEAFFRADGLRRYGNLPSTSPLRRESAVLRYTPGVNFVLHRNLRLKVSSEIWDFSDFSDEVAIHLGVAGNF